MRLLEIHLEVADLERSRKLYTRLIPHQGVDEFAEGQAVALILEDGTAFGLWKNGSLGIHNGKAGGHVHFAFQIRPDEYENYKYLIDSLGMTPLEHVWPNDAKSINFFDSDGHQGEFMTADWATTI